MSMKTFNLNTNNDSKRNKTRLLVLFVLLVLSSMGVFGQSINPQENVLLNTNSVNLLGEKDVLVSVESQLDFMGWFMGSKHTQNNSSLDAEMVKSSISTKKQVLSSGITPNKVLYRTFVKKVMNKDNAIA